MIQEVLRMYPSVGWMNRESPKGGVTLCGYYIPEGTTMWVSPSMNVWPLFNNCVPIASFLRHWCAEILSTSMILTHLIRLDLKQTKHGTRKFTYKHALSLAPPIDLVHLSTSRSVWVIARVLDVTLPWWVLKDCFKEASGTILHYFKVMLACHGPLPSPDWSQSYPHTAPVNLQGDTASFIPAGRGRAFYPTTKGQCTLHSSGNL